MMISDSGLLFWTTLYVTPPTNDGHDDDAEVEYVPRLFEVVQPQTEQLHNALESPPPQEVRG